MTNKRTHKIAPRLVDFEMDPGVMTNLARVLWHPAVSRAVRPYEHLLWNAPRRPRPLDDVASPSALKASWAKEVVLEAQRLGIEVIAVDRYPGAPAMQVAHRFHVIDMQDADALRAVIEAEDPDFIVPEIEAIATGTLAELEQEGYAVIPTARATQLTMDREAIRQLAAEDLNLPTSPYAFADSEEAYHDAVAEIGAPYVVKPVMSSSGKGQSIVRDEADVDAAWHAAISGSRGASTRVIVEGFVPFDTEITLLTVRHAHGTSFCAPVGHRQVDGDYRESWQPEPLADGVLAEAKRQAKAVTDALGGHGVFGVEFFIDGEDVIFSELSPRPHDTGMVTMVTQDLSEFALHVRAITGLPIPDDIPLHSPGASHAILATQDGGPPTFDVEGEALTTPAPTCACSANPPRAPAAAWASASPAPPPLSKRARWPRRSPTTSPSITPRLKTVSDPRSPNLLATPWVVGASYRSA